MSSQCAVGERQTRNSSGASHVIGCEELRSSPDAWPAPSGFLRAQVPDASAGALAALMAIGTLALLLLAALQRARRHNRCSLEERRASAQLARGAVRVDEDTQQLLWTQMSTLRLASKKRYTEKQKT